MEDNAQNLQQESINNTNQNISEPVVIKKYKWLRMLPLIQIIIFIIVQVTAFGVCFTGGCPEVTIFLFMLGIVILPLPFIRYSKKMGYITSITISIIISSLLFLMLITSVLDALS